jgi:predicted ATPase
MNRDPSPDPDVPLVDRDIELDALFRAYRLSLSGRAPVVLVMGDPGTGKTYLVTQFLRKLVAESKGVLVLSSAGDAIAGRATPLRPVIDMLTQLTGVTGAEVSRTSLELGVQVPPTARQQSLRALLTTASDLVGLVLSEPTLEEVQAAGLEQDEYKKWLQIKLSGGEVKRPDPSDLSRQITGLLTAFDEGTVLLLDDIQWIDSSTFNLISVLGFSAGSRPVLRIVTMATSGDYENLSSGISQGAYVAALRRDEMNLVIDLNASRKNRAEKFCREALAMSGIPPSEENVEALRVLTGGNALFVRDTIDTIVETGVGAAGPPVATDIEWDRLPARLKDNISRRLSGISNDAAAILEAAAVEGNRFSTDVVCAVQGMDRLTTLRTIDSELVGSARLVKEVEGLASAQSKGGEFQFEHDLYRRHIYFNVLGAARRRELHLRIAHALEGAGAGEDRAAGLAGHFDLGDDHSSALRWYAKAAAYNLRLYDYEAAGACAERGLHLGASIQAREYRPDIQRLHEVAAVSARARGLFRQAEAVARQGLLDPRVSDSAATRVLLESELARSLYNQDRDYDEAISLLRSALSHVPASQSPLLVADLRRQTGIVHQRKGDYDLALEEYLAALENDLLPARSIVTADLVNSVGVSVALCGYFELAVAGQRLALSIAEAAGDLSRNTLFLNDLSSALRKSGDLDESEAAAALAGELAMKQGKVGAYIRARYENAQAARLRGDFSGYEQGLRELPESHHEAGAQGPHVRAAVAELHLLSLSALVSEAPLPDLLERTSRITGTSELYSADLVTALLALSDGDLETAGRHAGELLKRLPRARRFECWSWPLLEAYGTWVVAAAGQFDRAAAQRKATAAFARLARTGSEDSAWREGAFLGRLTAKLTQNVWPPDNPDFAPAAGPSVPSQIDAVRVQLDALRNRIR